MAGALLLAILAAAAPAAQAARAAPARTIAYAVEARGFSPPARELRHFRAVAAATLADPRGWALNGAVRFVRRAGGPLRIALAAPAAVAAAGGGCSAAWSCRAGADVLINAERWRRGAATFPGRARLHAYRRHVIDHEVGHALGFGHATCPRTGARAPVMLQQSKALGGCRASSWPLAAERAALAVRLGVRIPAAPPRLVPGRRAGAIGLGDRRDAVRARLGDPVRRDGGIARYPADRLAIAFARGRVVAITTRSRADRTRAGVGVGTPAARLRGCGGAARRCVLGRPRGAPTTATVRAGRVVAVRIGRRTAVRARRRPARPPAWWTALDAPAPFSRR